MGKGKRAKASATLTVHFNVGKAEAGGFRHFVERQGRLVRGSRRIQILDTKWYPSEAEALRGLNRARRRFIGRL